VRTRLASFSGLAVAATVVLGVASPATAQQVVKFGEGQTLTISGFVNATMFTDRGLFGSFGQGQNAEFAAAPASQPTTDKLFTRQVGTESGARERLLRTVHQRAALWG